MKKKLPVVPEIPKDALRWTEIVEPDLGPPPVSAQFGTLTKGFMQNLHSMRVERACTSKTSHAFGQDDKTTSQGPKRLYSTKTLALKAMRNAIEREAAEKLNRIDTMIALAARTETASEADEEELDQIERLYEYISEIE